MNDKFTVGMATPLQPSIGAGNNSICDRCIVKMKHDVANRIADKVESMSFPSDIMDDELRDLLKLRRGQK